MFSKEAAALLLFNREEETIIVIIKMKMHGLLSGPCIFTVEFSYYGLISSVASFSGAEGERKKSVEYNDYMSPVGIRLFNRMPSNFPGKIVLYRVLAGKFCNNLLSRMKFT